MDKGFRYGRITCHVCGRSVADNWYVRHVKSDCRQGVNEMTIEGKMIFDDSGDPLEKKVQRAVAYYREKYGSEPTICKVSNRYLAESTQMAGVEVVPAQEVGTNNLFIGIETNGER